MAFCPECGQKLGSESEVIPEKVALKPQEIGKFLACAAFVMCQTAGGKHKKAKDMADEMEAAIGFGLILAKLQPELVDAAYQYWSYTRIVPPEEFVDSMLTLYRDLPEQ